MNSFFINEASRICRYGINASYYSKFYNSDISFVLPTSKILVHIEVDYFNKSNNQWEKPLIRFYKNGKELFSLKLITTGNHYYTIVWSVDERFIAVTETDEGFDHTTIIDITTKKKIKSYSVYEDEGAFADLDYGIHGSRGILFYDNFLLFIPTCGFDAYDKSHLKLFDCINLKEDIIAFCNDVIFLDLVIDDYIVCDEILCIIQEIFVNKSFEQKTIERKLRFLDIHNLVLKKEIAEYHYSAGCIIGFDKKIITDKPVYEIDYQSLYGITKLSNNEYQINCASSSKKNTYIIKFENKSISKISPPIKLQGVWEKGFSCDLHTKSSLKLNNGNFFTERTILGEYLYQIKYCNNKINLNKLVGLIVNNLRLFFNYHSAGAFYQYSAGYSAIDVIIPIPPSNLNRLYQPVFELVQKISEISGVPTNLNYLKKKPTPALKSIDDMQERKEILANAFSVVDKRFKGKKVLLFDDLYRSGETLNAATKVLKEQGEVAEVFVLTITKTRTKR